MLKNVFLSKLRTTNKKKFGLYNQLRIYIVVIVVVVKVSSFVPSAITQPFFELETPDFAWKFVWTVSINYAK